MNELTDEEIRDRLRTAMESSARGNTYAQWAATILPVVREIADRRAAAELHKAADDWRNRDQNTDLWLRARAYALAPELHGDPSS